MNKNEVTPVQIAIRIIIIIVVIILLFLVSFALIRYVPKALYSFSSFKNIFGAKEKLIVSLDKNAVSQGEAAVLTYRQLNGTIGGKYELVFSCSKIDSNTNLVIQKNDSNETLGCEDAYALDTASTSTNNKIGIKSIGNAVTIDQPIAITVRHVNASSTLATAITTLTIKKTENKPEVVATTTVATTTIPHTVLTPKPSTNYYNSAPANLSIKLGEVTVDQYGRAHVTFYVTNIGGKNSGSWKFSANLPRLGQSTYQSPYQTSIPPRGTSTLFLSFDNAKAGTISLYVNNKSANAMLK